MVMLFNSIIATTLSLSIVALVILALRELLRYKLSAKILYILWIILIIKIVFPFGPQSSISLFNLSHLRTPIEYLATSNYYLEGSETLSTTPTQLTNLQSGYEKGALLWALGAFVLMLWLLITYGVLNKKLQKAEPVKDERILKIFEYCKAKVKIRKNIQLLIQTEIDTPALMGIVRPRILLTPEILKLNDNELQYVFMHELTHYRRKDVWASFILLGIQIIHWFNPILWYSFKKIREDMEIATDESVLQQLNPHEHAGYGKALLMILSGKNSRVFSPKILCMADDYKSIKHRLTRIKLTNLFQKQQGRMLLIGMFCFVILATVLLTSGLAKDVEKMEPAELVLTYYESIARQDFATAKKCWDTEIINRYSDSFAEDFYNHVSLTNVVVKASAEVPWKEDNFKLFQVAIEYQAKYNKVFGREDGLQTAFVYVAMKHENSPWKIISSGTGP